MILTFQICPACLGEGVILVVADRHEAAVTPFARPVLRGSFIRDDSAAQFGGGGAYDPDRRYGHAVRLAAALGQGSNTREILKGAA